MFSLGRNSNLWTKGGESCLDKRQRWVGSIEERDENDCSMTNEKLRQSDNGIIERTASIIV